MSGLRSRQGGIHALQWIFIISAIFMHTSSVEAASLLSNPSFEGDAEVSGEGWQLKERTTMWKVQPSPQALSIQSDFAHSGQHSLRFSAFGKEITELWAFQYVPEARLAGLDRPHLQVSFWVGGLQSNKLQVHVDVIYADNIHLFARLPPPPMAPGGKFVKVCHLIPAYGRVRSLAVHLIVAERLQSPVHVDDVTAEALSDPTVKEVEDCAVFVDSFPKQRLYLPNFLAPPTSPAQDLPLMSITLATQMTLDRIDNLIRTAAIWKGPISAAILLLDDAKKQAAELTRKYYANYKVLQNVTFHVLLEDKLNGLDATMYPVNILRNVALKFARTSHVFFVDADIHPGLSERETWSELIQAERNFDCNAGKCAFIAPVLNTKARDFTMPKSKAEVLAEIEANKLVPYLGGSHYMVQFVKWKDATEPFQVPYVIDNEPYFVVPAASAPLLSPLMAGYGRDKCVYAAAVHAAGFTFVTMPRWFLVNTPDPGKTMYQRSAGLHLRVFMSLELIARDLEAGYTVSTHNFLPRHPGGPMYGSQEDGGGFCGSTTGQVEGMKDKYSKDMNNNAASHETPTSSSNYKLSKMEENNKESVNEPSKEGVNEPSKEAVKQHSKNQPNKGVTEPISDGSLGCDSTAAGLEKLAEFVTHGNARRSKTNLLDYLIQDLHYQVYVEFPGGRVHRGSHVMLNLAQPEAVVAVTPDAQPQDALHTVSGNFETIVSSDNASTLLSGLKQELTGPAVINVNLGSAPDLPASKQAEFLEAALRVATDQDLVLVEAGKEVLQLMHRSVCGIRPAWRVYRQQEAGVYLAKHPAIKEVPPARPAVPRFVRSTARPTCIPDKVRVDVILMTRNRPLQTYGFLDSLTTFVSGINTVWLLYRADDPEFEEGYRLAVDCVRSKVNVQMVRDSAGEFGQKLEEIVQRSEAQYLVLGVDEMLWVERLDLQYTACVLKTAGTEFFSVQLRLGREMNSFPRKNKEILETRFFSLKYDASVLAYYPKALKFDMGYILNVDGTLLSRADFAADLGDHLVGLRHPGELENGWMYRSLHYRASQWQLMYTTSKLTNNMVLHSEGRMADHGKAVTDQAFNTSRRFTRDRKKIDVEAFAEKMRGQVTATHISIPYQYTKLEC